MAEKNEILQSIKIDINLSDEKKVSLSLDTLANSLDKLISNCTSAQKSLSDSTKAVGNLENKMSSLKKGVASTAAAYTEFSAFKNSFLEIGAGTGNLVENLSEMAAAVTMAGAEFTSVFGVPAGLIVTGVTGVVGAIAGVTRAIDEMVAESIDNGIGNAIKEALIENKGISLDKIYEQYSDVMSGIGNKFSELTERTEELKTANSNIRGTWLEIEKIETAMDSGVISVREGKEELDRLFRELADSASTKFGELESTLVMAFGENGVLSAAFNELGYSTQEMTSTIWGLHSKVEQRIEEITTDLADMDPTNPEYAALREELALLTGETDKLSIALSNYESTLAGIETIDYSEFFSGDGTFDEEAVKAYLKSVQEAAAEANAAATEALNEIQRSLEEELRYAIAIDDEEAEQEIRTALGNIPSALEEIHSEINDKALALTDSIQTNFVESLDTTIVNAQQEWDNMGLGEKLWLNLTGPFTDAPDNKDDFVKMAIEEQANKIGEISDGIQAEMEKLGVEGAGWSRAASEDILRGLFDFEYFEKNPQAYVGSAYFSSNYAQVITDELNKVKEDAYGRAAEIGSDGIIPGTQEGINGNLYLLEETTGNMAGSLEDSTRAELESCSPSKVFERIGEDVVAGFNLGIEENTKKTNSTMSDYVEAIKTNLLGLAEAFYSIGQMSMQAFLNGLSSLELSLYEKAYELANNVKATIQTSLEIESPSKAMFKLGAYTIEGFKDGMESLYSDTYQSLQGFSYSVSTPEILYSDYAVGQAFSSGYNLQGFRNEYDGSNVNSLLPYLVQIAQNTKESANKDYSVNIGDREIAKANNRGQRALGRVIMADI